MRGVATFVSHQEGRTFGGDFEFSTLVQLYPGIIYADTKFRILNPHRSRIYLVPEVLNLGSVF